MTNPELRQQARIISVTDVIPSEQPSGHDELGVDGFRVDAVPYLVEREGTSCENLPETHEVAKFLRRRLDENYSPNFLLAEANQWPRDVRPYFGNGDEFHMAFHFPLMPRMFMAVKLEDRKPLVDILEQTPEIPPVNNLSSTAQPVELNLVNFQGHIPIEMFGGNPFPRIGKLPYPLTLGPYDFCWFRLRRL